MQPGKCWRTAVETLESVGYALALGFEGTPVTREELQPGVSLPRLIFRLPPDPSRLLRARERMRDYLQQYCSDQRAIDDVVLAVQEACTNAIRHSGSEEDIEVNLRLDGGDLLAEVRDKGRGFDAGDIDLDKPPPPLENCGRGLYLMAHLMDTLTLDNSGGLRVSMTKTCILGPPSLRPFIPSLEGGLTSTTRQAPEASREDRLHVLLEEINEAFFALNWEYRVVHVNRLTAELAGEPSERLLNREISEAFPLLGDEVKKACRDAMELGRPSVIEHYCPRTLHWFEIRVYPTLVGISLYLREIDERKQAEEQRRLAEEKLRQRTEDLLERVRLDDILLTIDQLIHSTLEIREIIHRALDESLAALHADVGTVEVREGDEWKMHYQRGEGSAEDERARPDTEMPVVARAARAKSAVAFSDLLDDPATAEFARDHNVRSCLAAPLIMREAVAGFLIIWCRRPRVFSPIEVEFARRLASSVSLALENSRLYEREARLAQMPATDPSFLWRFISVSRKHPLKVLGVASVVLIVLLGSIAIWGDMPQIYGIPGSLVALIVIITAALGGGRAGVAAAVIAGAVFFAGPAELGEVVSAAAALSATALWAVTALIVGYLTDALRQQARRQRAAALALGKAAAVRDAELAEQRRVESLAVELAAEREQLLTMIEQTDTSIAILDRDFVFQLVNSAYARNNGKRADELIGQDYFAVFERDDYREVFERARHSGEPSVARARPIRFQNQPERGVTYWDWRLAPVKDEAGRVRRLVVSAVDVTERVQSAQLSETLNAINARVSSRLDAHHIRDAVLELAGAALSADGGMVVVKRRGQWRPVQIWKLPAELETETFTPDEFPLAELALREQRPVFTAAYGEEARINPVLARRLGIEALVVIPLTSSKDMLGCLYFVYNSRREHSSVEIDFARKVGAVISQALVNARLLDDVQRVATTLQENLIHPLKAFYGLELGRVSQTAYQPELVGGDFSHVFRVDENRVGVLIGDVEGKGILAAGLTETVRSALSAFALVNPAPEFVLEKTNELLLEGAPTDQFVTACYLLIDLPSGAIAYAIAGHPAPVLLRSASCTRLDTEHGLPLGVFPGTYTAGRARLVYGDTIILFTDGLTETRRKKEFFGEQRVISTVCGLGGLGAQAVAEQLRQAAIEFANELRDDLQILTVRYTRR